MEMVAGKYEKNYRIQIEEKWGKERERRKKNLYKRNHEPNEMVASFFVVNEKSSDAIV